MSSDPFLCAIYWPLSSGRLLITQRFIQMIFCRWEFNYLNTKYSAKEMNQLNRTKEEFSSNWFWKKNRKHQRQFCSGLRIITARITRSDWARIRSSNSDAKWPTASPQPIAHLPIKVMQLYSTHCNSLSETSRLIGIRTSVSSSFCTRRFQTLRFLVLANVYHRVNISRTISTGPWHIEGTRMFTWRNLMAPSPQNIGHSRTNCPMNCHPILFRLIRPFYSTGIIRI